MAYGGSVKLTGESEYRNAIKNITRDLQGMSSALKSQTADFNSNDKSLKNTAQAQKQLNDTIKTQQNELSKAKSQYAQYSVAVQEQTTKHNLLNKEYKNAVTELERIKKASGENSTEFKNQAQVVDKLGQELVDSTEAMNESKSAMAALKSEINNSTKTINQAEKSLNDLGNEAEDSGNQAKKSNEGFTILKGTIANLTSAAITKAISGLKSLGTAIVNVGKEAVSSYAEYEQLVGGVETLFKDSAKTVQDYASQAYKTAGVSANKYMEQATSFSASLLQGLGGDTKRAAEIANVAIIDMADNANKMGTSIEMIQNAYQGFAKDNFTMLDNLKLGYGGTAGEMARLINETGVLGSSMKVTAKNVKDVPFDKMIEAIHKVQEQMGITGTTSKEAASTIQGSVNSMKASWSNLLTAIADDNQDLSKSVDEFIDSAITASKNLVPRIKQVVEGIKKLINGIINDVFPKLKKEIPQLAPLIDTFNWFVKNKSLVVGAITAMVGAFALSKVISFGKALSDTTKTILDIAKGTALATAATTANTTAEAANTAGKVVATGATGALTAATNLLNAAWKANPIGLVVAGITAAISIFAIFKSKTEELTEAEKAHKQALEEVNTTLDDYKTSMEEADKARQDYLDKNMSEISYYEDLYNELGSIIDENGKVKDGYEQRAKFITSTLSDALGVEIKLTDGVVQNYKTLEQKIKDVIEAKRAQTLVEANEGKYNKARDEKVKLEEAYAKALEESNNNEQTKNDTLQKMSEWLGISTEKLQEFIGANNNIDTVKLREYGKETNNLKAASANAYTEFKSLNNELQKANVAYNESSTSLANARTAYQENQVTITDYENALTNLKDKNYEAVLGIYEDTHTFIGKTDEETYNNYQKQINMQEDYIKQLKENKAGYDKDYIDKEVKKKEDVIKNLKEQQAQYKTVTQQTLDYTKVQWSNGLDKILSEITGSNIEFKEDGKGNVEMYIDGVKSGEGKSKEEMAKLVSNTITEVTKQDNEAKKAGENLIQGVNNGISRKDMQNSVFRSISSFGSSLLSKLRISLQEKSPSKATKEMGQFLLEGLGIGIDKEENSVLKQVTDFGKSVIGAMNTGLSDTINTSAITDIASELPNGNIRYTGNAQAVRNSAAANINLVEDFKQALKSMKIELDDEEVGSFIEKTTTRLIYT